MANIFDIIFQVIGMLFNRNTGGLSLPGTISRAAAEGHIRDAAGRDKQIEINGKRYNRAIIGATFVPRLRAIPGALPNRSVGKLGSIVKISTAAGTSYTIAAVNLLRVQLDTNIMNLVEPIVNTEEQYTPTCDGWWIQYQFEATAQFSVMPFLARQESGQTISSVDQNDNYILDAIIASLGAQDFSVYHGPLFISREKWEGKWRANLSINLTPWIDAAFQRYSEAEMIGHEGSIPELNLGLAFNGPAGTTISTRAAALNAYHMRVRQ